MRLAEDKCPCCVSEAFEDATPLLRNQSHHPTPQPTADRYWQYVYGRGDSGLFDHDGEMLSKNILVNNISNQSKPGKRAKAVFVANTLSPTLTNGSAVSGKYTSTREPKRINP